MPSGRDKVNCYSEHNQGSAEPERKPGGPHLKVRAFRLHGPKEQAEARHHKAEPHESQTRSDPREKRSLGCEIIGRSTILLVCHLSGKWKGLKRKLAKPGGKGNSAPLSLLSAAQSMRLE